VIVDRRYLATVLEVLPDATLTLEVEQINVKDCSDVFKHDYEWNWIQLYGFLPEIGIQSKKIREGVFKKICRYLFIENFPCGLRTCRKTRAYQLTDSDNMESIAEEPIMSGKLGYVQFRYVDD